MTKPTKDTPIRIDIDSDLKRELKVKAAEEGCSMKDVVVKALTAYLAKEGCAPGCHFGD